MDHIPIPIHNVVRPAIQVPVCCSNQFTYDDMGFMTYPYRVGISIDDLCETDVVCLPTALSFLQAWLWFGLLGDALGIGQKSDRAQKINSLEQFTRLAPVKSRILNTARLDDAVEGRRKTVALSSIQVKLLQRFDECLISASQAINKVLETRTVRTQIQKSSCLEDLGAPGLVFLSIQILIDTLRSRRSTIFASPSRASIRNAPELGLKPTLLNLLLREAGRHKFQEDFPDANIQIQFFMSSTFAQDDHQPSMTRRVQCSDQDADNARPHPWHTTLGCLCDMVTVPDDVITAITEGGSIPLVTYDIVSAYRPQIYIRAVFPRNSEETGSFVAFSHVRSRGFGNGYAHGLFRCQLALLQQIANQLVPSGSRRPVPFYIDTLSLPLEQGPKRKAVKSLSEVFEQAAVTAVLDPSLKFVNSGSTVDCILRIRFCDWKTRLWTLLEGSAKSKLIFVFANTTLDLDAAVQAFEHSGFFCMLTGSTSNLKKPAEEVPLILSHLRAFDHDLKTVCEADPTVSSDYKYRLRSLLRYGLLMLPIYHYLCESHERVMSQYVLYALADVYHGALIAGDGPENCRQRIEQVETLVTFQTAIS